MDSSDIRLGVIDDHSIFRDGVKRALTLEDDFKVIGEGDRRMTPLPSATNSVPT